ncbi:MAG TPA: hypothetical protein VK116_00295, partial [Planctomycetota bacterium]|nr:hypothetical protein [Planctomycetota bacterium]
MSSSEVTVRRKARAAAFALVCVAPFLVLEISSASGEDQETPAADHDRSVDRSEPDEKSASAKPAPRLGEPRRLTRDGIFKRDPVWARSPGGPPYLVYSVQHDSVRMTLVRLSDDGQEAPLHPKASLPEFRPTYSQDGSV